MDASAELMVKIAGRDAPAAVSEQPGEPIRTLSADPVSQKGIPRRGDSGWRSTMSVIAAWLERRRSSRAAPAVVGVAMCGGGRTGPSGDGRAGSEPFRDVVALRLGSIASEDRGDRCVS